MYEKKLDELFPPVGKTKKRGANELGPQSKKKSAVGKKHGGMSKKDKKSRHRYSKYKK
jgi:hypothetical protein